MKYKRKKDKDFWLMARTYLHDFTPPFTSISDSIRVCVLGKGIPPSEMVSTDTIIAC